MENVGLEMLQSLVQLNETVAKLENMEVSHSHILLRPINGYKMKKEQADQLVSLMIEAGFELKDTKRESYSIDRYLYAPDSKLRFVISHEPEEADRIEVLKERLEEAQKEWEKAQAELEKVNK
jgi:hypothetical protein